jgi:hypothetical protein
MAIAAGEVHSLALRNDGTVIGWGDNSAGQTNVPAGLSNVVAIAAGSFHNLALLSNSTVVAWGNNYFGQASVPVGLSNIVAVAADASHCLALKNDGTIVAWGDNTYGQTNVPVGLTDVVTIAAHTGRGMAITAGLKILSIASFGNSALLRFHGFAGRQYTVEYTSDLTAGNWLELPGGVVEGSGLDAAVMDTNAMSEAVGRFYRVNESQSP